MVEELFDVIICGTGFTECILSGLLSIGGKKVLCIDKNPYYGSEAASLDLDTAIEGYFFAQTIQDEKVFNEESKIQIHQIPLSQEETQSSNLLNYSEKSYYSKFLQFVQDYDPQNPATHQSMDLYNLTFSGLCQQFQLEQTTVEFIGNVIALHTNDQYLQESAYQTLNRIKLWVESDLRFGQSPFIYPLYGNGSIPECFSRLCAIYGGTFILNKPIDEILYDTNEKVMGIRSGQEVYRANIVICEPCYAPHKVVKVGQNIRAICIIDHPISNTNNAQCCQIIIPGKQIGRQNNIIITQLGKKNQVCTQQYYIATISTQVETENPEEELKPAYAVVGQILDKFITISDIYASSDDQSYDTSGNSEAICEDALNIYQKIMEKPFDFEQVQE